MVTQLPTTRVTRYKYNTTEVKRPDEVEKDIENEGCRGTGAYKLPNLDKF